MALPPQLKMTTALCLLSAAAALSLGSYSPESFVDITYGHSLPTAYGPSLPPPYAQGPLQEVYQYNQLQYNLPLGAQFDIGAYDPSRNVFTGLELTRDRIFLAVPRLYPGVPSTLNFVPRVSSVPNPPLQPYPGWEWQSPNGIGGGSSQKGNSSPLKQGLQIVGPHKSRVCCRNDLGNSRSCAQTMGGSSRSTRSKMSSLSRLNNFDSLTPSSPKRDGLCPYCSDNCIIFVFC